MLLQVREPRLIFFCAECLRCACWEHVCVLTLGVVPEFTGLRPVHMGICDTDIGSGAVAECDDDRPTTPAIEQALPADDED